MLVDVRARLSEYAPAAAQAEKILALRRPIHSVVMTTPSLILKVDPLGTVVVRPVNLATQSAAVLTALGRIGRAETI